MGTSPDELRARIDTTRQELSEDVGRLADHANPRHAVRRRKERMRGTMTGVRERVMGSTSDGAQHTADKAREGVGQAGEAVKSAPQHAARKTQGNPLAAGVIAFGAGMLAASMLRSSQKEEQAMGQLSEKASGLAEPVKEAAAESVQHLKEEAAQSGQQAAQQVKETATDAARTTAEEARGQAGDVKGQARQSGQGVAEETRRQSPGSAH
jgi:hypothetical protein